VGSGQLSVVSRESGDEVGTASLRTFRAKRSLVCVYGDLRPEGPRKNSPG
jgi:hypothetical protein